MLVVLPDFETPERCEALIAAARARDAVTDTVTLREVAAAAFAAPVVDRIVAAVAGVYGNDPPETVDYVAVTEMREGARHRPHADAERRTAGGGWEPNHTAHRTHTALLYLNSNPEGFRGGELRFARPAQTVTPRAGTLVLAPTHRTYEHEVLEVTRGTRWLLAVWFRPRDWAGSA